MQLCTATRIKDLAEIVYSGGNARTIAVVT
jgi:hypothetical protein